MIRLIAPIVAMVTLCSLGVAFIPTQLIADGIYQGVRARGGSSVAVQPKILGLAGKNEFIYGTEIPEVICTPLKLCVVVLEAGEVINSVNVGDKQRWHITPTFSGTKEFGKTHVIIKPITDSAETSLVITTTKRTYVINLRTSKAEYMPLVSFHYPETQEQEWGNYIKAQKEGAKQKAIKEKQKPSKVSRIENIVNNYAIEGKASWKPVAVYHDGLKTYIQFPKTISGDELPVLLVLTDAGEHIQVNYRLIGQTMKIDYVVDKGVLVAGIGDNQKRVAFFLDSEGLA